MAEDFPEAVQVAEASEEVPAEEDLAEAEADRVEVTEAACITHHQDHHIDHRIIHHHITIIIIHTTDQELHIIVEEVVQEAVAQHFS